MAIPSEVEVLRREVSCLLHEKIKAHLEPTSLDKYTLGTDIMTIEDLYTTISSLRSHIFKVNTQASEQIEKNAEQLANSYQMFTELMERTNKEIDTLKAQCKEFEEKNAAYIATEGTLASRLQSLEVQLNTRDKISRIMEDTYVSFCQKLIEMYVESHKSTQKASARLQHLTHENNLLRLENQRLNNELILLRADCDSANERANCTLQTYNEMGDKLNKLLSACSAQITSDADAEDRNINVEEITNAIKSLQDDVNTTITTMQRVINDQETIIAALTNEIEELQSRDVDIEVSDAKIRVLEEDNRKIIEELNSTKLAMKKTKGTILEVESINDAVKSLLKAKNDV